jgi:hypothetical protein
VQGTNDRQVRGEAFGLGEGRGGACLHLGWLAVIKTSSHCFINYNSV